ncbi:MAG TPA: response regulator transcription factor [Aquihabitans sp.]|jgi:DNA-binding NarL/FixJ family response regulator|nr:response regulator transcription factor [Aquihabitans sp.]
MRLILCDDHPIVVVTTSMLMEAHGHEIVSVVHRPQLLAASVDRHQPDACVVDLRFGSNDVAPALAAIAEVADRTSVVVLSGSLDATQHRAALAAGADAAVSKSIAAADLVAVVEGRDIGEAGSGSARREERCNPHRLTTRELQVLDCLVAGMSTPSIAMALGVSPATARSHLQKLMAKIGVRNRAAAVARSIAEGFAAAS